MIHIVPSAQRHHSDFGWLSTYWHFSFDTYRDPTNMNWGALRVFNDDVVQPGQGFGRHGHRDMEIVSYVLDGALEHQDSIGTRHVLKKGEVQVMSAGKGIQHSEYNGSPGEPVHFLQLWIVPRTKGSEPRWEQKSFDRKPGQLTPVVSSGAIEGTLAIDQDATIYLGDFEAGQSASHRGGAARKQYLFVMRGEVELNGRKLSQGDQARVEAETDLTLRSNAASEVILLDLPELR